MSPDNRGLTVPTKELITFSKFAENVFHFSPADVYKNIVVDFVRNRLFAYEQKTLLLSAWHK